MKKAIMVFGLCAAMFATTNDAWAEKYVLETPENEEYTFSGFGGQSQEFDLIDEGDSLWYEYRLSENPYITHKITAQYLDSVTGQWSNITTTDAKSKEWKQANIVVPAEATKIRFYGEITLGTRTIYVRNIKVSRRPYAKQPADTVLHFAEDMAGAEAQTLSTTMRWSNTTAFEWAIMGDGAEQFMVDICNNAAIDTCGTATIFVTYMHNKGATHSATLTITNGSFTHNIELTGATTKQNPTITWELPSDTMTIGETTYLTAIASNDAEIRYEIIGEEGILLYDDDELAIIALAEGTTTIRAYIEETDCYYAAELVQTITVCNAQSGTTEVCTPTVSDTNTSKVVHNGQLYIIRNNQWYDMAGRLINN